MSWILDGQQIVGNYYGQTVTGTVESSRVKYGGLVQYTVVLTQSINLRWRQEPVTRILLDAINVTEVLETVEA